MSTVGIQTSCLAFKKHRVNTLGIKGAGLDSTQWLKKRRKKNKQRKAASKFEAAFLPPSQQVSLQLLCYLLLVCVFNSYDVHRPKGFTVIERINKKIKSVCGGVSKISRRQEQRQEVWQGTRLLNNNKKSCWRSKPNTSLCKVLTEQWEVHDPNTHFLSLKELLERHNQRVTSSLTGGISSHSLPVCFRCVLRPQSYFYLVLSPDNKVFHRSDSRVKRELE